jgi:dolichol-phosphate mannosyltransferase
MRWLRFNAVGASGMVVHLGMLDLLVHRLGVHYLSATALSIEISILFKFFWHLRWTWKDRRATLRQGTLLTLTRFNLAHGFVSISGSLATAWLLTGFLHFDPLISNLLAILPCSIANFFLCDLFVFTTGGNS